MQLFNLMISVDALLYTRLHNHNLASLDGPYATARGLILDKSETRLNPHIVLRFFRLGLQLSALMVSVSRPCEVIQQVS